MFSGISSLSDLNDKFVKFTNNISNLDNMQADSSTDVKLSSGDGTNTFAISKS